MSPTPPSEPAVATHHMKAFIIDQVKAVHGPKYPQGHDWSVVIQRINTPDTEIGRYVAHAIVYTVADSMSEWKVVESGRSKIPMDKTLESLFNKTVEILRVKGNSDEVLKDSKPFA